MEDQADQLISTNKEAMLKFVNKLRERVERDEILQLMIVIEGLDGFNAQWTASEDKYAITGYMIAACLHRMKFD